MLSITSDPDPLVRGSSFTIYAKVRLGKALYIVSTHKYQRYRMRALKDTLLLHCMRPCLLCVVCSAQELSGGKLYATIRYMGVKIGASEYSLCDAASMAGLSCPVASGLQEVMITSSISSSAPTVSSMRHCFLLCSYSVTCIRHAMHFLRLLRSYIIHI